MLEGTYESHKVRIGLGTPEMEEPKVAGEVADILSKMSGVGKTNIYYLLAVKEKRSDLYEKVFDGSYSIGKAHTQMKRDEAPPTTEEERQEELNDSPL